MHVLSAFCTAELLSCIVNFRHRDRCESKEEAMRKIARISVVLALTVIGAVFSMTQPAVAHCGIDFMSIGNNRAATGQLRQAIAAYDAELRCRPRTLSYFQRARVHLALEQYKRAARDFARVVRAAPEWQKANAGLAWSLFNMGHPEKAEPYAKRAVELNPEDAYAWDTLAQVSEALFDIPQAAHAYRQVHRLRPEAPDAFMALSRLYALPLFDYDRA
ncbi:hypothetical protein COU20_03320 [Candidatus Kaiserbacteria bacterium CG10_big_fil_rev_8_21_14_0_10_59_10]|uniref:Uncharacterized protein n=1 Tax=Candidatus Kaiserbacteria bacterium CG10_big_fil_rev_8_21_14_0_10_59_10 TaxID=1974612 RepID=A0A2H0U8P6_9BACT|nr:MAG: hypothetical protein COU20_03320 [Candidatus Kaiserbacteria bacterium CG10_big_fil_rev_8_21_14_0_10_59_10]